MPIEKANTSSVDNSGNEPKLPRPQLRWAYVAAVAVPLIVLNTGWIANSEIKTGVTEMTISTLFLGVTFVLFVITLLNLAVRRFAGPRAAMNQAEMMALYSLLSISSAIAGVGFIGFFTPFLANPFYYDNNTNGWKAFWHLLPSAVGPRDPDILRDFYWGHSTFFRSEIVEAWTPHLIYWGVFFLLLLWTTLCMSAILRKRWASDEHLPFPVIALPLEITREGAPIYRNKLLWAGFAIPFCLHSVNTLASIFPGLPSFPINSAHDLVVDAQFSFPWSGAGSLFYQLHPAGVGFGYLVDTDVSFSLWFFYLLKKAVDILGVMMAWRDPATGWFVDTNGQFPFINFQGWGAWIALGAAALWGGRNYFKDYLKRAFKGESGARDPNEPMTPRMAVTGLVVGFAALCAFVWSWGGSWWLPAAFMGIYLLLMVSLARVRAETAVVCTELVWVNPQSILTGIVGTCHLSQLDNAHTATLSSFNLDYRAAPTPHQLEGMVGLERTGARVSPLVTALMLGAALSLICAFIWDLQLYYVHGAATGAVNGWRIAKGSEPWGQLQGWLQYPKPPLPGALSAALFGVAMTLLLSWLRMRFLGFPFHPAGYALNLTFANDFFWGDMFVAWAIKSLIIRFGGASVYKQALPFFLGLILGDFVTGAAWSIVGTALQLNLFRTFAS